MAWPDGQVGPGETQATALKRRVKMHEFLMTGGVRLGIDEIEHRVLYSPAIVDPGLYPVCPFHQGPCTAWTEILEGRGTGEEVADLTAIRNRTPEERRSQIAEKPKASKNKMAWYDDDAMALADEDRFRKPEPELEDARDTAIRSLVFGEAIPDEIVIEGDEEDED